MTAGSAWTSLPSLIFSNICSSVPRAPAAAFSSRRRRWRKSTTSRARASFSTTATSSPAAGVPFSPRTSTGTEGPASSRLSPWESTMARTRPHSEPATKMSPILRVPRCTRTVATEPRPCSNLASTTMPSAGRSGLDLRSRSSVCKRITSSSLSRLVFSVAEISTARISPPISSTTISCCNSSLRTRLASASGLSILLMATMIGTSAALAWSMASTVCGMTPSSAATHRTTISVTEAPRARISVKASWPGVSIKVILAPDDMATW